MPTSDGPSTGPKPEPSPVRARGFQIRIDWWSATGNTALGVDRLRRALETRGASCRSAKISLQDPEPPDFRDVDLWVLAAPVFDFRVALPLQRFLETCSPPRDLPVAALLTYAGLPDRAPSDLARRIRRTGARPWRWTGLVCEESWPLARRFLPAFDRRGEPGPGGMAELEAWSASLVEGLARGDAPRSWWRMPTPFTCLAWLYHPALLRWTFPITVDMSRCSDCGACEGVCPTGRIRRDRFPHPQGDCVGCYGCVNACPSDAIDTWLTRGAPRYRGPAST